MLNTYLTQTQNLLQNPGVAHHPLFDCEPHDVHQYGARAAGRRG